MTRYLDDHREEFGVEPICSVLQVAPATYYAAKSRPPSARRVRDEELKVEIHRVWKEHRCLYGADKIWAQLKREGIRAARCTMERLMRALGIAGVVRGKFVRTTWSDEAAARPADLAVRAPRGLKEPVRWKFSAFRKSSVRVIALSVADGIRGVRCKKGSMMTCAWRKASGVGSAAPFMDRQTPEAGSP